MTIRTFEGLTPRIHDTAYVDPSAVVIGDVELDEEVFILPNVIIRGDVNTIKVGAHTNIQDGSILHVNADSVIAPGGTQLTVGPMVTVGHRVTLHGCEIEGHSLIGMGATVMDYTVVERDVIIGAGSLVTSGKTLKRGHLYAGAPAKEIRPLKDEEYEWIDYTYKLYSDLKYRHRDASQAI